MKRNLSLFSNFGVTRLCGLWLYYWYWPSQGSGYYQSASSPLLLTISQSLHSGEWGLFCHNFLFSILQPSSPYTNIYLYDSHSVTQWTIRVICKYYKDHHHGHAVLFVLMRREKSQYESWVVWPPGRPSGNCGVFHQNGNIKMLVDYHQHDHDHHCFLPRQILRWWLWRLWLSLDGWMEPKRR